MLKHSELLPRYKQFRQVGLGLNNKLVKSLSREDLNEGGKKLGILRQGVLVFDTEDESSVLMDYCLHDVPRGGLNAIERYLENSPPPEGSDELLFLQAKRQSWYSVFVVESTEPGVGIHLRDLLRDELLFLFDVGFSQSAIAGVVLATRVMTLEGMIMSTGAGLPIGMMSLAHRAQLVNAFRATFPNVDFRAMSPDQATKLSTAIIRASLKRGAANQVVYADPGAGHQATRNAKELSPGTRAGRNDSCPCGSGKKFKRCCGAK